MTCREFKVLLLEDCPLYQHSLSKTINEVKNGFTTKLRMVSTLNEMADEPAPDCIIADLNVPDSAGLNTLLSIEELFPRIPVVVVTISNDPELAYQCGYHGCYAVVLKPAVELATILCSLFGHAAREADTRLRLRQCLETSPCLDFCPTP